MLDAERLKVGSRFLQQVLHFPDADLGRIVVDAVHLPESAPSRFDLVNAGPPRQGGYADIVSAHREGGLGRRGRLRLGVNAGHEQRGQKENGGNRKPR